jgi:hypothetical protein
LEHTKAVDGLDNAAASSQRTAEMNFGATDVK